MPKENSYVKNFKPDSPEKDVIAYLRDRKNRRIYEPIEEKTYTLKDLEKMFNLSRNNAQTLACTGLIEILEDGSLNPEDIDALDFIVYGKPKKSSNRKYTAETIVDAYVEDMRGIDSTIPQGDEIILFRIAKAGDEEARERVLQANLRFVLSVAEEEKYQNKGIPIEDLVNEGNKGLMTAYRRFDVERGIKFISYAVYWIRESILKAFAEQARTVRVPGKKREDSRKISKVSTRLSADMGYSLNPLKSNIDLEAIAKEVDIEPGEIEVALTASQKEVSFDGPFSEDNERTYHHVLPTNTESPNQRVEEDELKEEVDKALREVGGREEDILRAYFGFDDKRSLILKEIGKLVGLTGERVRQVKERTLESLRNQPKYKILAEL